MGPHWYENFGHSIVDPDKNIYGSLGRLCKWNMDTGELTVLLDDPEGAVRDPQVHYDEQRILFSYRRWWKHSRRVRQERESGRRWSWARSVLMRGQRSESLVGGLRLPMPSPS